VDPADDLIDACLTRYGQMMRALLHVRAASGSWNEVNVTLPQIRVLGLLAGHAEGLSGRALASLLGVGPSAVTPLVDRLVDHGYVRRAEDRQDRRITRLLLTPEGAAVIHQMAAGRREVLAEVLHQLEPEELAIVERAFELVALGVQRANPAAAAGLAACGPAGASVGAPVASTAPGANMAAASTVSPTATAS
jgi:MarR family transcriptional regulator, organic hydroperoxide resistance regulator